MKTSVSPIFDDPFQEYAGAHDYAEIFMDQMNCLYLLSFLVTADMQVAEKCFSKALGDHVENACGFIEWAKRDGRRAALRHAIQMIRPVPKQTDSWCFHMSARPLVAPADQPFAAITALGAFERFVFVMSVIEGLSEEECASLLDCSVQDVAIGRELARELVPAEDINCDLTGEMDMVFVPGLLGHQRCGVC